MSNKGMSFLSSAVFILLFVLIIKESWAFNDSEKGAIQNMGPTIENWVFTDSEKNCYDKCNKLNGTSDAKPAYCYEDCMGFTFLELLNTSVRCRLVTKDICPCGWAVCVRREGYPRDFCCPKDYDLDCCTKEPYTDLLTFTKPHKALNNTSDAVRMCFPIIRMITLVLMTIILPAQANQHIAG
ncbi:hypothetical protein niasHT_026326 [Heterodera trifolii]|uniref:Uncharacterized protein n=1 Tax=Heterodera trifolii TaxID=157864 RepID=A0ABD2K0E5_9BILA